jgi:hypothetical protein
LYLLSEVLLEVDLEKVEIATIFNLFGHLYIDSIFPCVVNALSKGCHVVFVFHRIQLGILLGTLPHVSLGPQLQVVCQP